MLVERFEPASNRRESSRRGSIKEGKVAGKRSEAGLTAILIATWPCQENRPHVAFMQHARAVLAN
jgi:hypothetical protein